MNTSKIHRLFWISCCFLVLAACGKEEAAVVGEVTLAADVRAPKKEQQPASRVTGQPVEAIRQPPTLHSKVSTQPIPRSNCRITPLAHASRTTRLMSCAILRND